MRQFLVPKFVKTSLLILAFWCGFSLVSARGLDILFVNPTGGSFNDPANWQPSAVPGAQDTALITKDGTYAVSLNASVTVGSLVIGGNSGVQTLDFGNSAPTLTLNGASAINANAIVKQTTGTLDGPGTVAV